jgi:hypothetical protein
MRKRVYNILFGKPEGKRPFERPGVDKRAIFT